MKESKELTKFQKKIIRYMRKGKTIDDISSIFKSKNIKPSSIPTIQREVVNIKNRYNCQNLFQLGYILGKKRR